MSPLSGIEANEDLGHIGVCAQSCDPSLCIGDGHGDTDVLVIGTGVLHKNFLLQLVAGLDVVVGVAVLILDAFGGVFPNIHGEDLIGILVIRAGHQEFVLNGILVGEPSQGAEGQDCDQANSKGNDEYFLFGVHSVYSFLIKVFIQTRSFAPGQDNNFIGCFLLPPSRIWAGLNRFF